MNRYRSVILLACAALAFVTGSAFGGRPGAPAMAIARAAAPAARSVALSPRLTYSAELAHARRLSAVLAARSAAGRTRQIANVAYQDVTPAPGFSGTGQRQPSQVPPASPAAARAVAFAEAQLGCPYVWGGTGPCSAGFDCSGLTSQAWAYAGVTIPRTSEAQWAGLRAVPFSQIQPGDLIIMLNGSHVGMYAGGGMMIDAPQPGRTVEKVPVAGWVLSAMAGVVRP